MDYTDSKNKAAAIGSAAVKSKADNVVILYMKDVSSFFDYFVIASAGSFKKTQGIAENIEDSLHEENIRPHHIEGRHEGKWILLDYGDVAVHVFHEEARGFYNLEGLWSDVPRVKLDS